MFRNEVPLFRSEKDYAQFIFFCRRMRKIYNDLIIDNEFDNAKIIDDFIELAFSNY